MITIFGKKVTANEAAKYLVADRGEAAEAWSEAYCTDENKMTQREIRELDEAVSKQLSRVWNFLGMDKLHNKIHDK